MNPAFDDFSLTEEQAEIMRRMLDDPGHCGKELEDLGEEGLLRFLHRAKAEKT